MLNEKQLLNTVSSRLTIPASDILSRSRRRGIADARFVYAYILRTRLRYTYQHIGDILNRRHASVMHMVECVDSWVRTPHLNAELARATRDIIKLTDKTVTYDPRDIFADDETPA